LAYFYYVYYREASRGNIVIARVHINSERNENISYMAMFRHINVDNLNSSDELPLIHGIPEMMVGYPLYPRRVMKSMATVWSWENSGDDHSMYSEIRQPITRVEDLVNDFDESLVDDLSVQHGVKINDSAVSGIEDFRPEISSEEEVKESVI
jgi:hypothetical protein